MVNYHETLTTSLNNILPTFYEMIITKDTITPCITYLELSNYVYDGDTLDNVGDIASISYQIKVWGNDIGVINENAVSVDETLKNLGWKRLSSQEMIDSNSDMIQKIMVFTKIVND